MSSLLHARLAWESQYRQLQLRDEVLDCVSGFTYQVNKAKANPIYEKYKKLDEKYGNDYDYNYITFNVKPYVKHIMDDAGDSWWFLEEYNEIGFNLNLLMKNPREIAINLINHRTDGRDTDSTVRQRIKMFDDCIIPNLSEKIVNQMKIFINEVTSGINKDNKDNYAEKKENILKNKANYRPAERQRPIAHSLRGHKSAPKRKSGLRQLENSVRKMW